MNKQERDLQKCEHDLIDQIVTSILFLNHNGIAMERVREMIDSVVDRAFEFYAAEDVLEGFKKEMKKIEGDEDDV